MARAKDILTTGQVADICRVAPRTVTKWFDSGRLKGYKIPGSRDRRIPVAELVRFMKEHNMPTDELERDGNRALLIAEEGNGMTLLAQRLRSAYDEVRTARSGFDAGLLMPGFMPDAVFVSLLSPGIDACEICREIRLCPELADMQIVAVADSLSPSEEAALQEKGFAGCLSLKGDIGATLALLEQNRRQLV